jgi:predicted PurR-regulated permease PerM
MTECDSRSENHVSRALEVSIHVGLLILLAAACLVIVRPFIPLIAWGIIIAIAAYPAHRRLQSLLGGGGRLAAVICALVLLAILIVPVLLLAGSLVEGIQSLAARLKDGIPLIPPPPPQIESWPVIGVPLSNAWEQASKNLSDAVRAFAPQIKAVVPQLLLASAGIGLAMVQWVLSIIVAAVLLANATSAAKVTRLLANRLFGDKGPEFERLGAATVRSVTTGIIGVALIQSFFAALGFLVAGLPGAGLWAVIFVFAAVLQVGALLLVPAIIYMFAIASTTKAIIFLVWCVVVALMDNVLKPMLLGRGVAVPMAVVFLGAIGGFVAMGILGLFVGAIVLSVGYKLFLAWLEGRNRVSPEIPEHSVAA